MSTVWSRLARPYIQKMMFDSKPRQILYTVIILSADNGLYDC